MEIPLPAIEQEDIYSFGFDKNLNRGELIKSSVVYNSNEQVNPVSFSGSGAIISDLTLGSGNIRSGNYLSGSSGWKLTSEGDFEGNSGTFRGNLVIGSGSSIFKADSNGIYLGSDTFADAPFRVTPEGVVYALDILFPGSLTLKDSFGRGWLGKIFNITSPGGTGIKCIYLKNSNSVDVSPGLFAGGDETNTNIVIHPKGTGGIKIATHTSYNSSEPHISSLLDLESTTKGILLPRMTTTQRDGITTPATGLLIYNTTTNKLNFYNSAAWEVITSA